METLDNKRQRTRKKVPSQRRTEGAAVGAVRSFFERHSQVYLEVDQRNDYGKDAYVDLAEDQELTGLVIAIQVKGGPSYRSGSRHHIPYSPSDRNLWVDSSIPVFGIVHDERDSSLYWVNLTAELQDRPHDKHGKVEAENLLDETTWPSFYKHAERSAKLGGRSFLGLHSRDVTQQHVAISDCFAIGRFDPRALVMLRRSLTFLSPESVEHAIFMLSHCVPLHPDRWWTEDNMVSERVRDEVLRELNWTPSDAAFLLKLVDEEDWFQRGGLGQDIYLLLTVGWGPDVNNLFDDTLNRAIEANDMDIAFKCMAILQYINDDHAPEILYEIMKRHPHLIKDPLIENLLITVQKFGWADIF